MEAAASLVHSAAAPASLQHKGLLIERKAASADLPSAGHPLHPILAEVKHVKHTHTAGSSGAQQDKPLFQSKGSLQSSLLLA
jgi:hypothetical protein